MKYIIQGAHVTKVYDVVKHGTRWSGYTQKPEFKDSHTEKCLVIKHDKVEWENIIEFECDRLEYSTDEGNFAKIYEALSPSSFPQIHISENESVGIKAKIFRADLNCTYLQSDKVLSEAEDRETNASKYQDALQEYYNYVIENNHRVKEYLDIHEVKDILENIDKIKDMVYKKTDDLKSLVEKVESAIGRRVCVVGSEEALKSIT